MRSPIDRAIAARNKPGQNPTRDVVLLDRQVPKPPIDFSPGQLAGEGPLAESARASLGALHESWNLIREVAKNPRVPADELFDASRRALSRAISRIDGAVGNLAASEAALTTKINEETQPPLSDQLAGEMRAFVRSQVADASGKPSTPRLNEVLKEVQRDRRVASAILGAPPMMSGLSDDMRERVRLAAIQAWCPEAQGELSAIVAQRELLERARERTLDTLGPVIGRWRREPEDAETKLKEMAG